MCKPSYGNRGKRGWSKGLTKETDERVARIAAQNIGKKRSPNHFSEDGLKRLSESAKRNGLGGYRPHPNKGFRYKDIWFDSKWEIAVAKSLDENKIEWIRPKSGFVWTDDGNKYYPDFFLPEYNVYLDPKNDYLRKVHAEKIRQAQLRNGIKILILKEDQLNWSTIKALVV